MLELAESLVGEPARDAQMPDDIRRLDRHRLVLLDEFKCASNEMPAGSDGACRFSLADSADWAKR